MDSIRQKMLKVSTFEEGQSGFIKGTQWLLQIQMVF